jgi:hypothetical protein
VELSLTRFSNSPQSVVCVLGYDSWFLDTDAPTVKMYKFL